MIELRFPDADFFQIIVMVPYVSLALSIPVFPTAHPKFLNLWNTDSLFSFTYKLLPCQGLLLELGLQTILLHMLWICFIRYSKAISSGMKYISFFSKGKSHICPGVCSPAAVSQWRCSTGHKRNPLNMTWRTEQGSLCSLHSKGIFMWLLFFPGQWPLH